MKPIKPNWINFKELRAQLSFPQVLEFYGVSNLSEKGGQLVGFCPIPSHNGNKNSPSFSAHPEKRIFQCFGCGAKGNILDFAVLMDNGNPKRGLDVRKTALKLNKRFKQGSAEPVAQPKANAPAPSRETLVNEPLGFRLKDLNSGHPYLLGRGFSREIMEKFGVGFCVHGVFAGRIVIPLHDSEANLVGYAGRVIDDKSISAQNPKYLFPGERERDGEILEFRKSLFLYNGYHFNSPLQDLIVVEGFPAVWWLTQHGFPEAVALMGSSASPEQLELIRMISDLRGRVWIMTDGDKAGMRCGEELSAALGKHRLCRVLSEPNRQPTDYSPEELRDRLGA